MSLGKKLKALRISNNLSQPDLAELVGIEQSYLSKLENDKSLPSNDVFRALLKAFNIELDEFMQGFNSQTDGMRLRQIPDMEAWFNQQHTSLLEKQRRHLYLSSLLIALSVTIFYIGYSKLIFSEVNYVYESEGIVLAGEPQDIFRTWQYKSFTGVDKATADRREKSQKIMARRSEQVVYTQEHRGEAFVESVEGGSRTYQYERQKILPRKVNAFLQTLGVFLLVAGVMGFVIERRLFRSA